jgi:hypothetical protein
LTLLPLFFPLSFLFLLFFLASKLVSSLLLGGSIHLSQNLCSWGKMSRVLWIWAFLCLDGSHCSLLATKDSLLLSNHCVLFFSPTARAVRFHK